MQVMPEVGKRVAKGLGYPEWDAVLLYQADANLEIGSVHLRALLDTQGSVVEVLAAYNAGLASRGALAHPGRGPGSGTADGANSLRGNARLRADRAAEPQPLPGTLRVATAAERDPVARRGR